MEVLEAGAFRSAMCRLASAVTLVTTDGPAGRRGLPATAVSSITDSPPSLLVCVNKSARSNAMIQQNGLFAINVLSADQQGIVDAFCNKDGKDPFEDAERWSSLQTGAPVLSDTLASLDCKLDQIIDIGTHSLFVGHVVAVQIGTDERGLVHFDRAYWGVGGDNG